MAQASSAQREPSMEEILASIRRIIEDSDLGRKPEDGFGAVKPDNDSGHQAEVSSLTTSSVAASETTEPAQIIDVEAFRAELKTDSAIADTPRSITLAEVQAQLAAEREGANAVADPEPSADHVEPSLAKALTSSPESVTNTALRESREAAWAPEAPKQDAWRLGVAAPEPVATEGLVEPYALPAIEAASIEAVTGQADHFADASSAHGYLDTAGHDDALDLDLSDFDGLADEAAARIPAAGTGTLDNAFFATRPTLISDQAGKKIAASFGELSEAFAARSRKNLDEVAEDMLRPMLQDWLDNNLPVMVERLVREEIDRIARG